MKKLLIFALVIATVAVMASCGTGAQATPTPSAEVTPTPTATPVDMIMSGPKANAGTVLYAIAGMYMENSGKYIQWKRTTTGTALAYCVTDNTDVAIIPRDLREEEIATYDNAQSSLLCTEALAVIVGSDCPITDITLDQLKQIYNGDITSWEDLGGSGDITVYAMSNTTSTGDAFEALVLGRDDSGTQVTLDSTSAKSLSTAQEVADLVASDSLAIGFVPLTMVGNYDGVKALSVETCYPSETAAKGGAYPLSRNYNLVTIGDVSEEAKAFIEYCTTDSSVSGYLKQQGYILP
jgi:phosphate transport system substrate-binding protein